MARLSVSELTTFRWSFEEDVCQYRAFGFSAMGVWRQKVSDYGEEKAAELLSESRLAVSSLSWAGGFTGSDGRSFRDSLDDAREAVRLAQILRAECLIVHSGSRAGHTHNHARRLLKNALSELVPYAREQEVKLAVEPMHPEAAGEWTFLTDLDETIQLLQAFEGGLQMVLDTCHIHDERSLARLPEFLPYVALVHLGDAKQVPKGEPNRCPLGEGVLPLREILGALRESRYDGYYEVELMGEEIEAADYRELLLSSKRFYDAASQLPPAASA